MAEASAADLRKQIEELNKKLGEAGGYGLQLGDAMRQAGDDTDKLNKILAQVNKQYDNLVNNADYIYNTFQDITAELKNQNLQLKIGKGAFQAFTNIAQDLNYYQKGYNDLSDKQFKRLNQKLKIEEDELKKVVERLGNEKGEFRQQQLLNYLRSKSASELGKSGQARLKQLEKERALLENANGALKGAIPTLKQEYNLSKNISNTRKDLGGIAAATGGLLSKYGGSLSQFLNIGEATEAAEEFNKTLIDGALRNKKVQDQLLDIEKRKFKVEQELEHGLISEEEHAAKLNALEKEGYDIKNKAIASTNTLGNKFKSLQVFAGGIGAGLAKALTDPLTIISFILERADKFNRISVDISKNFGYGSGEADKMAQSLADMSNNSSNLNFTLKNAAEAMSELNSTTGLVAKYSADTLETQIMLTKQFGLTGEEAAGIYEYSVLTGKASSQVNDEMVGAFVAARNSLKVGANFKQVMAEAAKVSGQLAMNFKNNPEAITKAIVQAKALGTTLEQTKSQGESLLDFESSIESELKAELLTGQQINLERARAAALMGDQVTVMKELANQGMTLEKFQNMNVLAQKSFAEALGLSADELSNQLRQQKLAEESGKSLAELQKEDALKAEKRQATQDKFNVAMEKLMDIVGNLVGGPFATLLEVLGEALNIIGYIVKPIEWLKSLATAIGETFAGWADALGPFGFILKGIAGIAILLAAYGAYAALAWIPIVGPLLGAAAAIAVTSAGFSALNAQKAGDMISPADGKTQVSTKEGGLFELSKNDDLVAGPGLASAAKGGDKGESIAPQIDLTPMIAAINQVKASVDRLYSKDQSVHMDGKKVGTTLTQGSYKVA